MRRPIQNIRYRFCFYIDIKLSSEIRVNSWVLTLPFAVTHGKNVQIKTEAILQRAFPAFSVLFDILILKSFKILF
jgi:hypothetical protein